MTFPVARPLGGRVIALAVVLSGLGFLADHVDAQREGQASLPLLTYSGEVAPLLATHCVSCHRPGGIGPFSLLTYEDVAPRASVIAEVVGQRRMPPWKPEAGFGRFQNERRLPPSDIERIRGWVASGAPRGSVAPALEVAQEPAVVSVPDLVVAMDEPFEVPADGHDIFRNFVVPLPAGAARWIRAWEFRPGNARVVHHATVGFDATGASRDLDSRDSAPGYEGPVSFSVQNPDGYFLGWSPGQSQPQVAAEGMAWRLPPDGDLLVSMHLRPTGRSERVQASIAFYFTDEAPSRIPVMLRLGRQDIDIPANVSSHTITNTYRLPTDVDVVSVYPHAHHLARQVRGFAVQPNGQNVELLFIRDWDFNWQDVYRYADPVRLRAGTVLTMAFTYDNSAGNPHNPHGPPTRVTFGPNGSDEMGDLWLQVVPVNASRRQALIADFDRKLLPETLAGVEMMLLARPDDLSLRNDAGLISQQLGRLVEARTHFEHALRLAPLSAAAHSNLASVLLSLGVVGQAERYLEQATALDGTRAAPHYLRGIARQLRGDRAGAEVAYRRALQRQPTLAEAHHLLASVLDRPGDHAESERHYRDAIRLRPDWLVPRVELAWSLATRPNAGAETIRLAMVEAEAAVAMARTAATLDALGAALARAGDFDQAVVLGVEAAALARSANDRRRAEDITLRVDGYRRGRPFVQSQ